jgi:hypothetical protein
MGLPWVLSHNHEASTSALSADSGHTKATTPAVAYSSCADQSEYTEYSRDKPRLSSPSDGYSTLSSIWAVRKKTIVLALYVMGFGPWESWDRYPCLFTLTGKRVDRQLPVHGLSYVLLLRKGTRAQASPALYKICDWRNLGSVVVSRGSTPRGLGYCHETTMVVLPVPRVPGRGGR